MRIFRRLPALCLLSLYSLCLCGESPAADPPKKHPANHLAGESSPYLLQHAHNPVDWYPWGPEAFAKAKKEGKLVFLSIGYSSCHWCHVMEKRVVLQRGQSPSCSTSNFVCIKVDREERPDIDQIYMTALNLMGQRGGWPMSMFLTAEGKPIVGGTYWPPEDRDDRRQDLPRLQDAPQDDPRFEGRQTQGTGESGRRRRRGDRGTPGRIAARPGPGGARSAIWWTVP